MRQKFKKISFSQGKWDKNGKKWENLQVWIQTLVDEHFFVATWLLVCNFIFPLKSLCKENILTNQMKNEYFQENLEKRIKITREMILSEVQNEIRERKSKSQGKWLEFERRKSLKNSRRMTFFDDENTKLRIIWIYKGNGIRNKT